MHNGNCDACILLIILKWLLQYHNNLFGWTIDSILDNILIHLQQETEHSLFEDISMICCWIYIIQPDNTQGWSYVAIYHDEIHSHIIYQVYPWYPNGHPKFPFVVIKFVANLIHN